MRKDELHMRPQDVEKKKEDFSEYSVEFQELIKREGIEKLLRECHFNKSFEAWKEERESAAKLMKRGGKILDFGCANGFLLACLKEWSEKELECFGLDSDPHAIERARNLFPEGAENHFPFIEEISDEFPKRFDTVYWNVWDDVDFSEGISRNYLERLKERARGGRIILGLYHADPQENETKMEWLKANGYTPTEIIQEKNGHIFVAIDVPEEEGE